MVLTNNASFRRQGAELGAPGLGGARFNQVHFASDRQHIADIYKIKYILKKVSVALHPSFQTFPVGVSRSRRPYTDTAVTFITFGVRRVKTSSCVTGSV